MNTVFFGSSKYALPIIDVLKENYDLSLVITTEKNTTDAIPLYCNKNKIPYISISNFSDPIVNYKLKIKNLSVGIVADFGLIIPNKILKTFPKGILNIHPSLLPKYRGPTPVQNAILNGDKETGVTLFLLDEKVDHGQILVQQKTGILPNDTAQSLYERLFKIGGDILKSNLREYLEEKLKPEKQNHSKATFTNLLKRQDGYIDLENPPSSEKLEKMIRAYYPWPGVWTRVKLKTQNKKLKTIKFLPNEKIQVEGKNPMTIKDFFNGYPEAKEWIKKNFIIFTN